MPSYPWPLSRKDNSLGSRKCSTNMTTNHKVEAVPQLASHGSHGERMTCSMLTPIPSTNPHTGMTYLRYLMKPTPQVTPTIRTPNDDQQQRSFQATQILGDTWVDQHGGLKCLVFEETQTDVHCDTSETQTEKPSSPSDCSIICTERPPKRRRHYSTVHTTSQPLSTSQMEPLSQDKVTTKTEDHDSGCVWIPEVSPMPVCCSQVHTATLHAPIHNSGPADALSNHTVNVSNTGQSGNVTTKDQNSCCVDVTSRPVMPQAAPLGSCSTRLSSTNYGPSMQNTNHVDQSKKMAGPWPNGTPGKEATLSNNDTKSMWLRWTYLLTMEKERLVVEKARLEIEKQRLALEKERFEVEKNKSIFMRRHIVQFNNADRN